MCCCALWCLSLRRRHCCSSPSWRRGVLTGVCVWLRARWCGSSSTRLYTLTDRTPWKPWDTQCKQFCPSPVWRQRSAAAVWEVSALVHAVRLFSAPVHHGTRHPVTNTRQDELDGSFFETPSNHRTFHPFKLLPHPHLITDHRTQADVIDCRNAA